MTEQCSWHIGEREKLGYIAWHHKAEESTRRGGRQRRCAGCGLFFFPWESRTGRFPRDGRALPVAVGE